jgi:class 3 adenylate cyclase/predicted metal-dependent HD superfamily phosphohydrolase
LITFLYILLQFQNVYLEYWWINLLVVAIVLLVFYFVYRDRLNKIQKQKDMLESQVKQRTIEIIKQKEQVERQKRMLEEEKEKTEKLLLNILPREMADELKNKGKAKARNYRQVTVMFTDFKGFTHHAEQFKPQELVAELDSYFIKFDEIVNKYNVEKIKTIGDAYMAAGGVPIRNKSNAIDTTLAALEIQRYMQEIKKVKEERGEKPWELRIGLHSGDLIAGVIGLKRFAYDIWGDTVNVAAAMEKSGEEGNVNISETTYEAIAEFFVTEYRGKIKAKHKGEIDMYYVHGIKPELSENEDGITPNEAFWHYVNLKLYSNINYRNAEKYIVKRLSGDLPQGLYYHGIHHTMDVCEAVERLAIWEGVKGEELYLLKTAALFHDAGFIHSYESNEPIGANLAKEMLPNFGYTEEQIQQVIELIGATKIPQNPKNHLEEIMCDSDLDYLGRDDFYPIAETLKKELVEFGKIDGDQKSWIEMNINFLSKHQYFTQSSRNRRGPEKQKRIKELQASLEKLQAPAG